MVENSGTMEDVPVPVCSGHLFLCEIGAGHLYKSETGAFNDAVGALSFGRGCDDLGLVVIYPSEALPPMSF